jgi:pyridoxal 5'-phosphate synthase pdxT subunit
VSFANDNGEVLQVKIGVLDLQGAVSEHIRLLHRAGVEATPVKRIEQLSATSGLIIPGGESTTIGRLMDQYGFIDVLRNKAADGYPIWGTCAGLIVMAERIEGSDQKRLQLMNMCVRRNAFGRQKDSFEADLQIEGVAEDFRAVFIRAPLVTEIGSGVQVLAVYDGQKVAVRQGALLASSFHPELTDDDRFHRYFAEMAADYARNDTDVLQT